MEAYANDACRTVAAQVSEAVGFQAMTQSTADTLAEVLASYIEEVRRPTHRRQAEPPLDTRLPAPARAKLSGLAVASAHGGEGGQTAPYCSLLAWVGCRLFRWATILIR